MKTEHKQWIVIAAAMTVTLLVFGYKLHTSIIPASAEYLAEKMPQEIYHVIGEQSLQSLDESEFSVSKLPEQKRQQVIQQFEAISKQLELTHEQYKLEFRYWNDTANAFALADGTIILTDKLVNKMQTEQQLAAIILHEVGHVEHNHNMENLIRTSLFYISLSLFFGDISVVSDLLIEASTLGANLDYSREFENEADAYSAAKMQQLYGDVSPLKQAMQLLHDDTEKEHSWFSTHPGLNERLDIISSFDG